MGFFKQLFVDDSHREVNPAEVASAIESDTHTVVDVREPQEWQEGHIAEAVHIPLGDLAARASELPADKPIYTVCRSGKRSQVAIDILDASGRTGGKSLAGGMIAWAENRQPIAR